MDKINQKYCRRAYFYSRFFCLIPFLRCLILNGSVAVGQAREISDIDILIITKTGRIFTTRFLTLILASILGIKRSKDETKPHAGKFCFNYFLADNYLKINAAKGRERYCAENYSKSVLVWGDELLFKKFFDANEGLFNIVSFRHRECDLRTKRNLPLHKFEDLSPRRQMARDDNYFGLKLAEFMFSGRLGDWLERLLKKIQIRSIEKDPRTRKYPDAIVYNDRELRFHPERQYRRIGGGKKLIQANILRTIDKQREIW